MRSFPASTCLNAIAITLVASSAMAQTTVSTETTTPLVTSAAGNISITEDGSIAVASGAAVTVDSNNTVTSEGSLEVGGANGASGITIKAGTTTTIDNSGTISVTEDFVPADEDNNGIADGPIASASNRYGIHTAAGGTTTGTIDNSGTIIVEGLNSGGIVLDSRLDGSLINSGTISVTGDYSYGIKTADVTGNLTVNGTVTAVGEGATALAVTGDVGGTLTVQGTVQQAISYTNDDSETTFLSRGDVRAGTPAAVVSGNVAGGIIIAAPPADTDSGNTDEDGDGVTDSEEGTGSIISYGNGPALLIGGAGNITIGPVSGNADPTTSDGYSLVIDGSVQANAYYSSTDAFGLVIGGKGGTVDLAGGIGISGTVTATTNDSAATAILINQGATVPRIYNSGTISAGLTSPGEGSAHGIYDLSGTLTQIDNTGFIVVTGTSEDVRQAIDLSSNTTGVTISQYLNAEDAQTKADNEADLEEGETDTTVYAAITGDIVTGSGNDTLTANAGEINGNTYFNAGDDRLLLSGDAAYTGKVYFGAGAATAELSGDASLTGGIDFAGLAGALTIADQARFTGTIANGSAASVTVNGGTFGAGSTDTITIDSLTINSGGTLGAYIDGASGTSSRVLANSATFADGAKVSATISSLVGATGSYTILTADSLSGDLTFDSEADLPYIFAGSVSTSGNDLILEIRRKSADELGLRRAAAQGYQAILAAAVNDGQVSDSFLEIEDAETLQGQLDQLLPDHAGGIFDTVTRGSRLVAQHVMDGDSLFDVSKVGGWLEPVAWRSSKDAMNTQAYETTGWGMSGGLERATGIGSLGISYAFLTSEVENNGGTGKIDVSQHELGLFWRIAKGPLYAFARASAGRVSLASERSFTGTVDDSDFTYSNTGEWKGWLYSAAAGASYDVELGDNFTLRPKGVLDYYRLDEDGYTEIDGGEAMDLTVESRTSTAVSATATLAASYRFGPRSRDGRPLTVELEGGRRDFLSGSLGTTRASFADGEVFAITPDDHKGAWLAEARLLAGGWDFTWKLSARAEKAAGDLDYSGRASLSVAF